MKLNELDELLDSYISPKQINLSSFQYKKKLNERIWHDGMMNPKVRERLLNIGTKFIKSLEIDENILPVDIIMVGSLASYNWSKYSDIDLHIVIDFKKIANNEELVRNYFMAKKNEWNMDHENLLIYGYPVETYVLDKDDPYTAAGGVYSIKYDRWIKIPTGGSLNINKVIIKKQSAKLINTIEYYMRKYNEITDYHKLSLLKNKTELIYNTIRDARRTGLAAEGEASPANIVFKVLRRSGHLQMLYELKNKLYDKLNSIL